MRLLIQRVKEASVLVENKVVGAIANGALVFFGVHKDDTEAQISYLAQKLINLRMFGDENDKMNLSLLDIKGEILVISQFTLYADCSEGRRPDFFQSAPPIIAKPLYEKFVLELKKSIEKIETGIFGAKMEVRLINDGPVTFIVDGKS
jgi:D-tyrosyl-tRNA(Tyr) deacylase